MNRFRKDNSGFVHKQVRGQIVDPERRKKNFSPGGRKDEKKKKTPCKLGGGEKNMAKET